MSDQWIRVSCASLCRIEHGGRFLLLLNHNRLSKGLFILTPVGGALTFDDPRIPARFEATPEDPTEDDLRLQLPMARLSAFRDWFLARRERECSPFRELFEELVLESKLLTGLQPDDVVWDLLWTHEEETYTQRRGQTGLLTHYFLEIYRVRFQRLSVLGPLLTLPPDSGAAWLSDEQLRAREPVPMVVDGVERQVQVNGHLLVEPPAG